MVSVWRDDSLAGVALAERDDSSGWNLVFERARMFTDVDRKAGQASYCITNEAGTATYGGGTRWAIDGTELKLALDAKTGQAIATFGKEGRTNVPTATTITTYTTT